MALLAEIATRRAKRALREETIPDDTIQRLLTAATYAPSCANKQPWRFVVINQAESLAQARPALAEGNYWAKRAPLLVLAVTKPELACQLNERREYALFDVGLATGNLLLQAEKEGLIAHPLAGFDPLALKDACGIPAAYILVTVIVIGFPGDPAALNDKHRELEQSARSRKPETEVICYNTWSLA